MAETDRTVDDGDGSMLGGNSGELPPELRCLNLNSLNLSFPLDSLENSHHNAGNITSMLTDLIPDISKFLHAPSLRGGGGGSGESTGVTCPMEWDNLVCWPETLEGYTATSSCFGELNGILYDRTSKWLKEHFIYLFVGKPSYYHVGKIPVCYFIHYIMSLHKCPCFQ